MPIDKEELREEYEKVKDKNKKWSILGRHFNCNSETVRTRFRQLFGNQSQIRLNSNESEAITADTIANEIINRVLKHGMRSIKVKYDGRKNGKIKEHCGLVLGDIHIGKKNIFYDPTLEKNIVTYDHDIMWKEAERLVNTIYEINDILLPSYMFEKLHILCVGDLLDNHMIYPGQSFSIDADVGKQLWDGVSMFVEIIQKLLVIFKEIEIDSIPGNHGRMSERPMEIPPTSNFDYQLMRILQVWFRDEPRVTIKCPESWYMTVNIKNWTYFLHHGNTVYSWMSMPYYGVVRQSKARRTELKYDIEIIGHFHHRMEIPTSSRTYTLVNGPWIAKDAYGWKKFGSLSKPEQYFFGISDKRPISWKFELDLSV